jgi:hypothetical protein
MSSSRRKQLREEERLNAMAGAVPESLERLFEELQAPFPRSLPPEPSRGSLDFELGSPADKSRYLARPTEDDGDESRMGGLKQW